MSTTIPLLALSILLAGPDPGQLEALRGRVRLLEGGTTQAGLFPDLKSALAAADDGDHLVLEAGLYTGSGNVGLVVERDVVIRGRHGAAGSVIDCRESGRAFELRDADAVLQGLTIRRGRAERGGGALVCGGTVVFEDVVFEENSAITGGGLASVGFASVVLNDCRFLGNSAMLGMGGGGGLSVGGAGRMERCLLMGNEAGFGGGLAITSDIPPLPFLVSDCTFLENSSVDSGGAVAVVFTGILTLDRCTLIGNVAGKGGGGISFVAPFGILYVQNSLLVGNTAQTGAGAIQGDPAGIHNCTVVGNVSHSDRPGGIWAGVVNSPAVVLNSIVRDNVSAAATALEQQIRGGGSSGPFSAFPDITVLHSNVTGLTGLPTNIDEDPLFVDPSNGDYHIEPSSPCVDAGLAFSLLLVQQDIDGEPRIQGPSADIGADEVPLSAR